MDAHCLTSAESGAVALIELSDDELAAAAMAARGAAALAEKDAAKQTTPTMRSTFEDSARRYRELAERFETGTAIGSHPARDAVIDRWYKTRKSSSGLR
jgi:hypothetical protein